jgi:hypothetical protein
MGTENSFPEVVFWGKAAKPWSWSLIRSSAYVRKYWTHSYTAPNAFTSVRGVNLRFSSSLVYLFVVFSKHFPKPYIEPKESNVRKSINKEKEWDKKRFLSDFRWPDICLKKLNKVPKPWYNSRSSGQDVIVGLPECQTEIRSYITVIIFITMIDLFIIIVFSYYDVSRNLNSYTSLLGQSSYQIALTYMAFP